MPMFYIIYDIYEIFGKYSVFIFLSMVQRWRNTGSPSPNNTKLLVDKNQN